MGLKTFRRKLNAQTSKRRVTFSEVGETANAKVNTAAAKSDASSIIVTTTDVETSNNSVSSDDCSLRSSSSRKSRRTVARAQAASGTFSENHSWVDDYAHVQYEEFGNSPRGILKIEHFEHLPMTTESDNCVIEVETSTVSEMDCIIRKGAWNETIPLPITPGFDFVGRVLRCGSKAHKHGIKAGDRVCSLVRVGGNSRYITCRAQDLIKVPESLDAAEAVSVIVPYMSAFQSLNVNNKSDSRYKLSSVEGKSVLVIGGSSNMGQALLQLAFLSGARKVYATADRKHHRFLKARGAVPLGNTPTEWLPLVAGKMDIVIDTGGEEEERNTQEAVRDEGIVVNNAINRSRGWFSSFESFWSTGAHSCDILDCWDNDRECFEKDLQYLFHLLDKKTIKPNIAGKISLKSVLSAQDQVQHKKTRGVVVCKPLMTQV